MNITMDFRRKDPAVIEIERGGERPFHHVLHRSELEKVGLIALGIGVSLTALSVFGHYKLHQARIARRVKKQLAPLNEELESLRAENEALRQQLAAQPQAADTQPEAPVAQQ